MKRLGILLLALAVLGCSSKEERRDALIANAKKLEQAEKCAEAKIEARNAIKLDPNSAEAYLVMGSCAVKEQDWRNAFGYFNRALEIAPDNLTAMENMARLYLMANDTAKSKELIEKLLADSPKSVSYRVIQAGVALREKQVNYAIQLLKEVLLDAPQNEEAVVGLATSYIENGQLEQAKTIVAEAITHNDKSAVLVNYMLNIAVLQKDYGVAIRYLKQLRALQPDNENILLRIADMYLVDGKAEQAVAFLESEVKAKPEKTGLRGKLAEFLFEDDKNEEGIAVIEQAPILTPQLSILKATGLLRLNRADEAIAELQKVSNNSVSGPDALQAKQHLAEIYILRNRSDEAIKELSEIIKRNPGDNKATALRGRLYYLRGQYADAVADLRTIIRDNPKDAASALALTESQRLLGNTRLAEETIRASIDNTPGYIPSYLILASLQRGQGNTPAAAETLKNGAANTNAPDLHFAYVDTLVATKHYREAQDYLSKLVAENSDIALPGFIRLAAMNAEQRKFSAARDYYSKALLINPENNQAAEGYILMEVGTGRIGQALAWAQDRAKTRPEDPNALALLAEVYNESKNYEQALAYFKQASQLAPVWEQPYLRIMQIYNTEFKKPEEAVSYLRERWSANQEVATPAIILASYYETRREYAEAEKLYRAILEKSPELIAVNNNLAYIMITHEPTPERLEEALTMAQKAAASHTPETLDTLGWVYFQLKKLPEALENTNKAYERSNGAAPVIGYHLAVVHNALGNKDEAKKILGDILENPKSFNERKEAEELYHQL